MAKLTLLGPPFNKDFPLSVEATIGRQPDNYIHIPEPKASRKHARLAPHEGGFILEDLNSSNGTEVNGQKISKHTLKHNDLIQIGATRMVYVDENAPAGSPTPDQVGAAASAAAPAAAPVPAVGVNPASVRLSGQMPSPAAASDSADSSSQKRFYTIQVEGPSGTLLKAELSSRSKPYSVGATKGHDIVIEDPNVDSPHMFIEVGPSSLNVENHGKKSPVTVGGQPLPTGHAMPAGENADIKVAGYQILIKKKRVINTMMIRKNDGEGLADARRTFIMTKIWPEFESKLNIVEMEKRGAKETEMRREALVTVKQILNTLPYPFEGSIDKDQMATDCVAEFVGLGPMEELLADGDVNEIMVNGPDKVFIERKGKLILSDKKFLSSVSLRKVVERIVASKNRRVDESMPYVDTRLDDGSRVHAIIPPLALDGPTVTIRKFPKRHLSTDDLIGYGAMNKDIATFLELASRYKNNIVVSGGTGSGKTTILNCLSRFIPDHERVITCEDSAELRLQQPHVVRLESRPPNIEGKGAVTIRDLVRNCLRMRPDRIIVGECRGGEAFDMLQAMNTGHEGSMTTVHANTTRDAVARIESMCLMAGLDLPISVVRQQIVAAVSFIFQQSRMMDGTRKNMMISEITGLENGQILMQPIFEYKQTGYYQGKVQGYYTANGLIPKFIEKLREMGEPIPMEIFKPTIPPARKAAQ